MTVSLCAFVCLNHLHNGAAGLRSDVPLIVTQSQSGFLSKQCPALMASLSGHGLSKGVARKTWGAGGSSRDNSSLGARRGLRAAIVKRRARERWDLSRAASTSSSYSY